MNLTCFKGDITFWDRFAPWYEKWLSRGRYHVAIMRELSQLVEPGWHILDVGAATGALSIPLTSLGCKVTAIDPSKVMSQILKGKLSDLNIKEVEVVTQKWEDYSIPVQSSFDLIVACNSLHLTRGGLKDGMLKVFSTDADNVCLITEINQGYFIDFKDIDRLQNRFNFLFIKNLSLNSSFYFQDMEEAWDFMECFGLNLNVTQTDDKPVHIDKADIAVIWWERKAVS